MINSSVNIILCEVQFAILLRLLTFIYSFKGLETWNSEGGASVCSSEEYICSLIRSCGFNLISFEHLNFALSKSKSMSRTVCTLEDNRQGHYAITREDICINLGLLI